MYYQPVGLGPAGVGRGCGSSREAVHCRTAAPAGGLIDGNRLRYVGCKVIALTHTWWLYWICVLGILGQRGIIWMMCRNITFAGIQ